MRLIEVSDKRNAIYLLPIGDLHLGSPQSNLAKFEGYLTWAKKEKAYIFLMGDLYDIATTQGPTSPFECSMPLRDCKHYLRDRLMPVKHLILGGIIGNHEQRLIRFANEDLIEDLCDTLEIPYAHYSAVLRLNVGRKTGDAGKTDTTRVHYTGYCHHTRGGGGTPGGKLNRVAKLAGIFEGADFLVGAHNHMQAGAPIDKYHLHVSAAGKCKLSKDKLFLVDSGSFVEWEDSYAEEQGLDPTHCGCPRIRLDGTRKDIHVSE